MICRQRWLLQCCASAPHLRQEIVSHPVLVRVLVIVHLEEAVVEHGLGVSGRQAMNTATHPFAFAVVPQERRAENDRSIRTCHGQTRVIVGRSDRLA
jgi:hypothetical protein